MFIRNKRLYYFLCLQFIAISLLLTSCTTVDLYEKVETIPKQEWSASYKPQFTFTIKDTTTPYQVYLIVRHNNQYKYNNIWVNLYAQAPADSIKKFGLELPLANKDGWLGSGMDDIFEHRIAFTLDLERFRFKNSGAYTFMLEQIMRDDPLPNILNVGIRIEKKAL